MKYLFIFMGVPLTAGILLMTHQMITGSTELLLAAMILNLSSASMFTLTAVFFAIKSLMPSIKQTNKGA